MNFLPGDSGSISRILTSFEGIHIDYDNSIQPCQFRILNLHTYSYMDLLGDCYSFMLSEHKLGILVEEAAENLDDDDGSILQCLFKMWKAYAKDITSTNKKGKKRLRPTPFLQWSIDWATSFFNSNDSYQERLSSLEVDDYDLAIDDLQFLANFSYRNFTLLIYKAAHIQGL